jgi:two-component system response regulator AtoC
MGRVQEWASNAAAVDVPVLILGESGTGKEVLARALHAQSGRSSGPFVKVNCPAIPGGLLESEMFGYEQGAFTGAVESRGGLLEAAEGGTLFLDEVGDLDSSLQAKLLHFLQDGGFMRLGGQQQKRANARIVCATNRNLRRAVDAGSFRRDLFYRINVLAIEMPPLRRRRDDIPALVEHFLHRCIQEFGTPERQISPRILELLIDYDWPGNIRELENLIKRYAILGSEEAIASDLLGSAEDRDNPGAVSLKSLTRKAIRSMERKIILRVLYDNNWNRKKASEILKISYRTLFYKLKDVGIAKTNRFADTADQTPPARSQHQETRL